MVEVSLCSPLRQTDIDPKRKNEMTWFKRVVRKRKMLCGQGKMRQVIISYLSLASFNDTTGCKHITKSHRLSLIWNMGERI